jgi:hypothetical protein
MVTNEIPSKAAQRHKDNIVEYVKLKYDLEYAHHLDPDNLTLGRSLDDEQSYTNNLHALSHLDPDWSLESVRERVKEDKQDEITVAELGKLITPVLNNRELRSKVEALLDQELSESNRPESKWKGKGLTDKVRHYKLLVLLRGSDPSCRLCNWRCTKQRKPKPAHLLKISASRESTNLG